MPQSGSLVHMVRTPTANVASVLAAFDRLGVHVAEVDLPEQVERAAALVLPGVGAFDVAMRCLHDTGIVEPLRRRIRHERPTLAICLGMQVLFESSDESPGVQGLGVAAGAAARFPAGIRVPQMGWNRVTPDSGCRVIRPGCAYFANSYRIASVPPGWNAAWSDHGGAFLAAMERGPVVACQFHPELSGAWGARLLARWLVCSGVSTTAARSLLEVAAC